MTRDVGRVAVQVGGATVRVAVAGAAPELVAELPGGMVCGPIDLLGVLASIVGPAPRELVLVHPAAWSADRVATWPGRPVPAPVAAAGRIRRIVVEAKHSGTDVTLVHGGRVILHRRCPVGGAALDAAVARLAGGDLARARRAREVLSLHPTEGELDAEQLRVVLVPLLGRIVDLVRAVHEAGAAPVLLIGGVARSPVLAELLDEAGLPDVEVASRPQTAAVSGALAFPIVNGRAHLGHAVSPAPVPARWLPLLPAPPRRPARQVVGSLLAAVVVAALPAAGSLLPSRADAASVPAGVLVQYGYRFDVPAGWEHSGGLPDRRRSLLRPAAAPEGSDLIAVERTPLGYDTAAEPERARAEL